MKIKHKNVLVFFAIVFFMSIGPIFNSLPVKLLVLLIAVFLYCVSFRPINISNKHLFVYSLLLLFLSTTGATCLINRTATPLIYSLTFVVTIFCAIQLKGDEMRRVVIILSKVLKYTIILAWIGYVYSLVAPPLFSLVNPNGTQNYFYLTTFSVTVPPIRPSGFYDEPGAFSFFICLLVFFRTYLGLDLKENIFLMVGGLITQSLAHVIFIFVWLASVLFTNESKAKLSLFKRVFILMFFCGLTVGVLKSGILEWAIERSLSWYEDPNSAIRVRNFNNALSGIQESTHSLMFGFNSECTNRIDCEGLTENLLTPIAMGGLLASWPFYLFLLFCFLYPIFTFSNFTLFGIGLLLLQRPYFLELPYSFCLAVVITLFINGKKSINLREYKSQKKLDNALA